MDAYAESDKSKASVSYHRVNFTYSPDGSKVAFATSEGLVMEIFEIEGLELKPKTVKYFHPYEVVTRRMGNNEFTDFKEDNIKGVMTMKATDRRLVAAYNGTTSFKSNTDITVWDWNGRPLRRYGFDGRIMAMSLSPDNPDDIYALVHKDDDELSLVRINCPGLLD